MKLKAKSELHDPIKVQALRDKQIDVITHAEMTQDDTPQWSENYTYYANKIRRAALLYAIYDDIFAARVTPDETVAYIVNGLCRKRHCDDLQREVFYDFFAWHIVQEQDDG